MSLLSVSSIQNPAAGQPNILLNADGSVTLPIVSGTAPAQTQAGTLWYDTSGPTLQIRNAANTAWLPVGGGGGGVSAVTGTAPIVSSGGATPAISLATSGVGAGSYSAADITVDAYGRITAAANGSSGAFPSGTRMLFQQTTAPTGWVKDTTYNNYAMRIVNGAVGTGGTVGFTTAFASGLSSNSYTLTIADIPNHGHTVNDPGHFHGMPNNIWQSPGGAAPTTSPGATLNLAAMATQSAGTGISVSNTGGGGGHSHGLPSFDVQYVDFIIATKS